MKPSNSLQCITHSCHARERKNQGFSQIVKHLCHTRLGRSHVYLGVEENACTGSLHISVVTDQA